MNADMTVFTIRNAATGFAICSKLTLKLSEAIRYFFLKNVNASPTFFLVRISASRICDNRAIRVILTTPSGTLAQNDENTNSSAPSFSPAKTVNRTASTLERGKESIAQGMHWYTKTANDWTRKRSRMTARGECVGSS